LGTVTDAYQPVEERFEVTRRCLEQLLRYDFPISIQTKSSLVIRDLDLIKGFSNRDVGVTITTLNEEQSKVFEPFAFPPMDRLSALSKIAREGIDTWVFIGPILPGITDDNLNALVEAVADSGAKKVVIDRLRLRGRIWDRIEDSPRFETPTIRTFKRSAKKILLFKKIEESIAELCRRHDIECEQAFPSSDAEFPKSGRGKN
ncbi:MAG: radical SAM protein, partial [Thermoplasmata archaeon]|nr:radical SAM protein [Thermoplasmata archaeon]